MKRLQIKDRRNGMALVLGGLCLLLLGVPSAYGQVPIVHADFPTVDAEIPITQWQLLGPFRFAKNEIEAPGAERLPVGLSRDYLREFGRNEASVDSEAFPLIKTPNGKVSLDPMFSNKLAAADSNTHILELASKRHLLDYSVAYAAVVVESPRDQEIVIAVGADDNFQLRLNHELLFADLNTAPHGLWKFRHLIGATLKKGSNFLLVKVGNLTQEWRLLVTLYPHERALTLARENGVNPILVTSVVAAGHALELRGDLLPSSAHAQFEVADYKHAAIQSGEVPLRRIVDHELGRLPRNALYYCRVKVGGETIERPFYFGDLDAGYQRLSKEAERFETGDEAVAIDLQAQLGRLKHLLVPESRKSEFWDQKVARSFSGVEDNLAILSKGTDAFRHAPGTHIRGYRSAIDGQIQNYWVHVPERALQAGKPIPIVITLPYITDEHLPFLESYFLAAFEETERYRILGDEYGYAVLQVLGRGNLLGGTAIGTADVFEALDAVRKDYPIDSDRVYLLGYCEAGRIALLLAERYPNRFAAVSVEAPITVLHGRSIHANKWLEYASPINAVENLKNTAVFISHDEADTPPVQESEDFASRCRKASVDVTLVKRQGGSHGFYQNPMAEKRALFEFFRGKQRQSSPSKLGTDAALSGFGAGRGPIEDAFGAPILIVEGTLGAPTQRAVVHDLVQMLVDEWQKSYFVNCPVKQDVEITDADIQKYNLIIVGDAQTNSLAKQMADRLPFRTTTSQVSLAGRTYEGTKLGYEFISPDPLNPEKYVVVIGMNQWSPTSEWKLNPSGDGICDYFIFDLQSSTPRLTDAGYFDAGFWQQSMRSQTSDSVSAATDR